jgi:hypothetical protein
VTEQTTHALEEIGAAMAQVVNLTEALATLTDCFQTLLDALDAARVDATARAAEAELAKVERTGEALQ